MVSNINNEKYDFIDKIEKMLSGGQGPDHHSTLFSNYGKMDREDIEFTNNLNKLLTKTSYLKAFLVLAIKEVTWNNELKKTYNIYNGRIKEFFDLMNEVGFIISKPFGEIDELHYFTILELVSNPEKFYNSPPQIIILTEDGKKFSEKLLEFVSNKNNQSLVFTLQQVIEKTKAYKTKLKQIEQLEYSQYSRYITYPNGITVNRRTILGQELDKEKKEALKELKVEILEHKQQQGLLSKKQTNQLTILQNKNLSIVEESKKINKNKCSITYKGIYSNFTDNELIKESEKNVYELSKYEEKKINKESYKGVFDKEQIKKDEEYVSKLKLNGYHNSEDFNDEYVGKCTSREQTPEEFLDSLVGF